MVSITYVCFLFFSVFGVNEAVQSLVNSIKESPLVKKSIPLKKKDQPNNVMYVYNSILTQINYHVYIVTSNVHSICR